MNTNKSEISGELPNWSQSDLAEYIVEKYRGELVWDLSSRKWYRHNAKTEEIWQIEPRESVTRLVKREIDSIAIALARTNKKKKKPSYTINTVRGIISIMKIDLSEEGWSEQVEALHLLNGFLKNYLRFGLSNKRNKCQEKTGVN